MLRKANEPLHVPVHKNIVKLIRCFNKAVYTVYLVHVVHVANLLISTSCKYCVGEIFKRDNFWKLN